MPVTKKDLETIFDIVSKMEQYEWLKVRQIIDQAYSVKMHHVLPRNGREMAEEYYHQFAEPKE